jgi:putative transposase
VAPSALSAPTDEVLHDRHWPRVVRQPRVRDRAGADCERIRFSQNILPRYARLTKNLEALIPILYLKGISTGNFEEALSALVGADAPGL